MSSSPFLTIPEAFELWQELGGNGYASPRALRQAMRNKGYGQTSGRYFAVTEKNIRDYLEYVQSRGNVKMTTTSATAVHIVVSENSLPAPRVYQRERPLYVPDEVRPVKEEWNVVKQMRYGDRYSNKFGRVKT